MIGRHEFYEKNASKQTKRLIVIISILAIIVAASCLVDVLFGDLIAVVSVLFYLSVGIIFLIYRNWMLPLAIFIYSIIFSIMIFDGVTLILTVILSAISFFGFIKVRKINRSYEIYQKTGVSPERLI